MRRPCSAMRGEGVAVIVDAGERRGQRPTACPPPGRVVVIDRVRVDSPGRPREGPQCWCHVRGWVTQAECAEVDDRSEQTAIDDEFARLEISVLLTRTAPLQLPAPVRGCCRVRRPPWPRAHGWDTCRRARGWLDRAAPRTGPRQVGADVSTWPVRSRPDPSSGPTVHMLEDAAGPAALASADLVVIATDTGRHVADAVAGPRCRRRAGPRREAGRTPADDARDLCTTHPRAQAVWVAAPLRAHEAFRHLYRARRPPRRGGSAHVWSQSWLPDWRPERDYRESYSARADEGGVLRDLVHEIDYADGALRPAAPARRVTWIDTGPLDIDAEQAATLLWQTGRFDVTAPARLRHSSDHARRPRPLPRRRARVGRRARRRASHHDADGEVMEQVFQHDLDRDIVMGTQARAALDLRPTTPTDERLARGAPATLATASRR